MQEREVFIKMLETGASEPFLLYTDEKLQKVCDIVPPLNEAPN
jgi:hypothetical protein